jgi:hypothetical protein
MATESVLINGREYDFSACKLDVFGMKIVAFSKVTYADALEIGSQFGASQVELADTKGVYKAEAFKLTLSKSTGADLRTHIAAKSRTGNSLGGVRDTIVLQFVDDVIGVQNVIAKGCRVTNPGSGDHSKSPDPLSEEWEFKVKTLSRNGITLFESDEPGV